MDKMVHRALRRQSILHSVSSGSSGSGGESGVGVHLLDAQRRRMGR
jgi:hypothetical protein